MSPEQCASCPLWKVCPIHRQADDRCERKFTDQELRLAARRREQDTEVFRERDTIRSGIESTNSGLKNRLGLSRLKVRGRGSVLRQLLLKVTGWNLLRAAAAETLRTLVHETLAKLLATAWSRLSGHFQATIPPLRNQLWHAPTIPNTFPTRPPFKNVPPQTTASFVA